MKSLILILASTMLAIPALSADMTIKACGINRTKEAAIIEVNITIQNNKGQIFFVAKDAKNKEVTRTKVDNLELVNTPLKPDQEIIERVLAVALFQTQGIQMEDPRKLKLAHFRRAGEQDKEVELVLAHAGELAVYIGDTNDNPLFIGSSIICK